MKALYGVSAVGCLVFAVAAWVGSFDASPWLQAVLWVVCAIANFENMLESR